MIVLMLEVRSSQGLDNDQLELLINMQEVLNQYSIFYLMILFLLKVGLDFCAVTTKIQYDYIIEGSEFAQDQTIPRLFSNLKKAIARHILSDYQLRKT